MLLNLQSTCTYIIPLNTLKSPGNSSISKTVRVSSLKSPQLRDGIAGTWTQILRISMNNFVTTYSSTHVKYYLKSLLSGCTVAYIVATRAAVHPWTAFTWHHSRSDDHEVPATGRIYFLPSWKNRENSGYTLCKLCLIQPAAGMDVTLFQKERMPIQSLG